MLKGMATVLKHVFKPSFTVEYPEEKFDLPERERGRLLFLQERCIKCGRCERICPNSSIEMEVGRRKGSVEDRSEMGELELESYSIHHGLCIQCGLCVSVCPTNTLAWAKTFHAPTLEREDMLYDLDDLRGDVTNVFLDEISESPFYDREKYKKRIKKVKEGEKEK